MRVMMSAAGSAVAPGIIRHLQSLGHYVIGHDCCEYGWGLNEADEAWTSPRAGGREYADFLEMLVDRCDVYLPFLDEELHSFALAKEKPKKWLCSSTDAIIAFTSKRFQQDQLKIRGLPVAPEASVIFKAQFGRGSKGVFKSELFDGLVMQRLLIGQEYTIDILTDLGGAFLFAVPRLRIQANGVSVIGKIVMDEEIIDLAKKVVSEFKFAGPINIQVIREGDTGKLYIIDVNPRLSGSCIFTVMAGFDILDATIKLWEGKPFVPPATIDDGLIVRRHYVEERL